MKKLTLLAAAAALVLGLSACGNDNNDNNKNNGGTTNHGGNTGGGDTSIPSASKAPTISSIQVRAGGGSATISTFTDVIAKCTFVYKGSINKTVVATRTEEEPGTAKAYRYTSDVPTSIGGDLHITATCQNDKGTATKNILN